MSSKKNVESMFRNFKADESFYKVICCKNKNQEYDDYNKGPFYKGFWENNNQGGYGREIYILVLIIVKLKYMYMKANLKKVNVQENINL